MPYLFVLGAILTRVLPHPWNLTPLGAMFLFSGATFQRKWESLAIPFVALIASDYVVLHTLYGGRYSWFMPYTWMGFLLVGLIAWMLRGDISIRNVLAGSLAGSIAFFLVSNFGVWVNGSLYAHNLGGLFQCYAAGIPFFRNTVMGDLLYAALMLGSYELVQRRRMAAAAA